MLKIMKNKGFTLIELMIVVALIGVLAAVILPKIFPEKAKIEAQKNDDSIRFITEYKQAGKMSDKYNSIWIMKDKTTGVKYLVLDVYRGGGICVLDSGSGTSVDDDKNRW